MHSGSRLVSTNWLDGHLDAEDLVVVEVSSRHSLSLDSVERHVPNARFVYWRDLCWDDIERRFPDIDTLVQRLQALGVSDESTIAIVGDPFQYGTYAFWVLAMAGFEDQTVLVDGGRQKWLDEDGRLGHEATSVAAGQLSRRAGNTTSLIGRDDVVAGLHCSNRLLLDVRSNEEYNGERVSHPGSSSTTELSAPAGFLALDISIFVISSTTTVRTWPRMISQPYSTLSSRPKKTLLCTAVSVIEHPSCGSHWHGCSTTAMSRSTTEVGPSGARSLGTQSNADPLIAALIQVVVPRW